MGDLVNLRTVRKRHSRAQKEQRAQENRALFGRSKAERALETARAKKAEHELEGKRLDKKERE